MRATELVIGLIRALLMTPEVATASCSRGVRLQKCGDAAWSSSCPFQPMRPSDHPIRDEPFDHT